MSMSAPYLCVETASYINKPLSALYVYRDFISWGYKPHLEVLDKLLACLRLQPSQAPQQQQRQADIQRAKQLQAQLQPLLPGEAQQLLEEQCDLADEPCVKTQVGRIWVESETRGGGIGVWHGL